MVCIAPVGLSSPVTASYVNAAKLWAQGVEMQMAMAKCWLDIASTMNPLLPSFDVHKLARPHKAPSQPEPAAPAPAKPKTRRSRPTPKMTSLETAKKPAAVVGAADAPDAGTASARPKAKRKPAARVAAPKAKSSARRRKEPAKPEQPFKE